MCVSRILGEGGELDRNYRCDFNRKIMIFLDLDPIYGCVGFIFWGGRGENSSDYRSIIILWSTKTARLFFHVLLPNVISPILYIYMLLIFPLAWRTLQLTLLQSFLLGFAHCSCWKRLPCILVWSYKVFVIFFILLLSANLICLTPHSNTS